MWAEGFRGRIQVEDERGFEEALQDEFDKMTTEYCKFMSDQFIDLKGNQKSKEDKQDPHQCIEDMKRVCELKGGIGALIRIADRAGYRVK